MERIKNHLKKVKPYHIASVLAIAGLAFAAANSSRLPFFSNIDNFILFAKEEISIEKEVQVSSGDLGSNGEIDIEKDAIINGNLFADEITIDKNSVVNGNASFNKLELRKDAQILGAQTKPVSLPIANLPNTPDFSVGNQDFKFEGQNNTLVAGSYRDLTLEKDGKLVLSGGAYNINRLFLKENSTLIFSAPTTLNIKKELKGQQHIAVLPSNNNLKPADLIINYQGKKEKEEQDKDDKDKNQDKEKEEGFKPVEFGKNSFFNLKLLAPRAEVHIGENSTLRGQVMAKKVKIEKGSILSRQTTFSKESDPDKITIDSSGDKLILNEIVLVLNPNATFIDAQRIANIVNGNITAVVGSINLYKIEVSVTTLDGLRNLITRIRNLNDPKVEVITTNNVINLLNDSH